MPATRKTAAAMPLATAGKVLLRLLQDVGEGVYFTDPNRRIVFWNKAAERISGYRRRDVLGRHCADNILMHVDGLGCQLCRSRCPLARTLADRQSRQNEIFLRHRDGHRVPVTVRTFPLLDDAGTLVGAAELFSSRSIEAGLRERLRELEHLAMVDRLTGVANRRSMDRTLQARLDAFEQTGDPFGLIFFDIDNCKQINDHYSHRVGDNALRLVARTLRDNIRDSDQAGRWGGEEFVVIVGHADRRSLHTVAEKLRHLVETSILHEKEALIPVTVSGGAALVRTGDTAASLVERADLLMYKSKHAGKNRIHCA